MAKVVIFLSHISEEKELAEIVKQHLQQDFLSMIDIFVSSDAQSIRVGDRWLDEVDRALGNAKVEIILCSEASVRRPWINFEAGAGWVRRIPVVPLCHTGMRPVDLPIPLNMLQAADATKPEDWEKLYRTIADQLGSAPPSGRLTDLVQDIATFERRYGVVRRVQIAVSALVELVPQFHQVFLPTSTHRKVSGDFRSPVIDSMRPHLDELEGQGMLSYSFGDYSLAFGEKYSGGMSELKIEIHDAYGKIAFEVMP